MRIKEKIYKKLLQVPSGKITTYGELSRSIGLENGQRIVGQIMKKNPFPVIIPCHRVVKSNGSIGGYAFGYQEASTTSNGGWSNPYPNLVLGYHTGVQIGGHTSYQGIRFYNDHPSRTSTKLFSMGEGDGNSRCYGNLLPHSNNSVNLGSSSLRWANLYVNDLQLSNEAKKETGGNDVDGTWGDWTLQEGEDHIYMINNRTGKKFKMNLTEVS